MEYTHQIKREKINGGLFPILIKNKLKTRCPLGHIYDKFHGPQGKYRSCRICNNIKQQKYYDEKIELRSQKFVTKF